MSELEDMISSVLNDPEQMNMISSLAKSLMGGQDEPGNGKASAPAMPDIDPAMLGRISRLMQAGNEDNTNERALLEAMRPYLSEKRRNKMDRAMKIAKLARIAKLAIGEMGAGGDV